MAAEYDRSAEDLGNIVGMEHVNVCVPDQRIATLFYITGMGFTRDPYLVTGVTNMWVNIGRNQFHLPAGEPQVLRGRVGIVVPELEALDKRLGGVERHLTETRFGFKPANDHIDVTCPWGNALRAHAPDADRFGPILLGIPYIVFDVPEGTSDGIARFYSEIFAVDATTETLDGAPAARVPVGHFQNLYFREKEGPEAEYDGHHFQIYLTNFSGPHRKLLERDLVSEENNQYQYRFLDLADPASGETLFRVEHEVRSMTHPLYGRKMINRNPAQTNNEFAPGYDDQPWAMPLE